MGTFLSSETKISDVASTGATRPDQPTAVVGFVGVSERGPIGTATLVTSFTEYRRVFGSFNANAEMTLHAYAFFQMGGKFLWVCRTCHYTDVTSPSSYTATKGYKVLDTAALAPTAGSITTSNAAPYTLVNTDDLWITVDGDLAGPEQIVFTGTAATRKTPGTETWNLDDGDDLQVKINAETVAQVILFATGEFVNIHAATAEEVCAVINAKIVGAYASPTDGGTTVSITSDRKGLQSHVQVVGGTANAAGKFNFSTLQVDGTGNVDDIAAVRYDEIKALVEAGITQSSGITVTGTTYLTFTSNTTGASSSVHVVSTSTADDEMGLDNAIHSGSDGASQHTLKLWGKTPGAYANRLSFVVANAASGTASEFNLDVRDNGVVVEQWKDLTMDSTLANYVETVINDTNDGSDLISAEDLGATGTPTDIRPTNVTTSVCTGGDDGLTSLADADYVGSESGQTGLYAFDGVSELTIAGVPGVATAGVVAGLKTYTGTARDGRVMALPETPASLTYTQMVTYCVSTATLYEASEESAILWPRGKIVNPSKSIYGDADSIAIGWVGQLAGKLSYNDDAYVGGVYMSPAGKERGVWPLLVGLEDESVKRKAVRDILYPKRINPVTQDSQGGPYYLDGGRTCKSTGNWPHINQKRGVITIKNAVQAILDAHRHDSNTPELRAMIERQIETYLLEQMYLSAFASKNPDEAFNIDASTRLNTPAVVAAGKLKVRIGLAMATPSEFISVEFSSDVLAYSATQLNA